MNKTIAKLTKALRDEHGLPLPGKLRDAVKALEAEDFKDSSVGEKIKFLEAVNLYTRNHDRGGEYRRG